MAFDSVPQHNPCPEYSFAHRGLCTRMCARRAVVPDTQRPDLISMRKRRLGLPPWFVTLSSEMNPAFARPSAEKIVSRLIEQGT
jgi:hypothetical protein